MRLPTTLGSTGNSQRRFCRPTISKLICVRVGSESMPSDLVVAYRATDYVAFNDSRAFLIRVGRHSLVIDGLLTRMKTRSGAFIAAWNPFSKRLTAESNA